MKFLLLIFVIFLHQSFYGQNGIEIKIINDTIKKNSVFDVNNVCYDIINKSDKPYYIVIDDKEFNTAADEFVEDLFLGLPDYRVFNDNSLMKAESGIANIRTTEDYKSTKPTDKDLRNFKKKYKIKSKDLTEILISYKIFQKTKILQPKQSKSSCTNVNFPFYIASSYPSVKIYELENNLPYFFQILLNIPKEIIDKYFVMPKDSSKDVKIFTGTVYSNKVPLVYKVYNGK
ncbi:hypothetical protein [Chryseobacterium sp. JUb7]|uniref:hypothetical protein n=1 Tax=Chryseobacterium sp. JUb7 TaxID=2940599 RepID=UPI002169B638|nr:hypothetical protein [Chryseobacterium sp. JUb7]MCS3529349.1 hypothetical protein [Chryseobacterium sp. JUb7]